MGKRYREREERAEFQATIEVGGTSSNDILQLHGLVTVYPSYEEKKNRKGLVIKRVEVEVRGQDVFARGKKDKTTAWEKFLISRQYIGENLISLIRDTDRLTEEYFLFLVNSYTDRYSNLDMDGRDWLHKVVRLAVIYQIMENKLSGQFRALSNDNDDEDYFCNDFAMYYYLLMRTIKRSMQSVAIEINHIIKEPEKREYYLKLFFDEHYQQLRQTPFPQQDAILHLLKFNMDNEDEDEDGMGMAAV